MLASCLVTISGEGKKMKYYRSIWIFLCLFSISTVAAFANEGSDSKSQIDPAEKSWNSAVEYGRQLFSGTKLGTNGKSCAEPSCHKDRSNLIGIAEYPKYVEMANRVVTMGHMINFCIHGAVKGKMLDLDSTKIIALQAYIKSLEEKTKSK